MFPITPLHQWDEEFVNGIEFYLLYYGGGGSRARRLTAQTGRELGHMSVWKKNHKMGDPTY